MQFPALVEECAVEAFTAVGAEFAAHEAFSRQVTSWAMVSVAQPQVMHAGAVSVAPFAPSVASCGQADAGLSSGCKVYWGRPDCSNCSDCGSSDPRFFPVGVVGVVGAFSPDDAPTVAGAGSVQVVRRGKPTWVISARSLRRARLSESAECPALWPAALMSELSAVPPSISR